MHFRKAQSSMEFLMSYGWILAFVLVILAALSFFGLLNPQRYLPDVVEISPEIKVLDSAVDENSVTLIVQNNVGEDVHNFKLNVTQCNGGKGVLSDPVVIPRGKTARISVNCRQTTTEGTKFKSSIEAKYTTKKAGRENILSHMQKGEMRITVNPGISADCDIGCGYGMCLYDKCWNDVTGYWSFEDGAKDESGNGQDGECSGDGCPMTALDRNNEFGNAYLFDGDDYFYGIDNEVIDQEQGTIFVWAKPSSFDDPRHLVWAGETDANGYSSPGGSASAIQELHLSIQHFQPGDYPQPGFTFFYGDEEDTTPVYLTPAPNHIYLYSGDLVPDVWYNIVVTWDLNAKTAHMYLNGNEVDSEDLSLEDILPYDTDRWLDDMHIGKPDPDERYFDGVIDEIVIFNRSLTAGEVQELYDETN